MSKEHASIQPEASSSHNREQSIVLWRKHSEPNHHVARGICRAAAAGLLIFATTNNAYLDAFAPSNYNTKIVEAIATEQLPLNTAQTIQSIDNLLSK
ncbi:MAG: hypothetical protein Q8P26_00745 [Candidatus Levybacteria bacterium]|nr:hypothetical protein [Candidatus Levybacteria bacterium]